MCATVSADSPARSVKLAEGGRALLPVVVAPGADEQVRSAAADLADYLGRISGADFQVEEGDGSGGIVVGATGDFPVLDKEFSFATTMADPDHYHLVSGDNRLVVLGSTPLAAEFGVWDLLYRFGFRQYFPGPVWEIVPRKDSLSIGIREYQKPDYFNRSGPRGAYRPAHRPWRGEAWEQWITRNRTAAGFQLHTGHAYDGIVRRNQAAFDAHPEFFALIDGRREQRPNPKFCIGNEAVRALVIEDALRLVSANPELDSISMDPSDGGGWCDAECGLCMPLGSVSDRVVLLANEVAEALVQNFDKPYLVGIYAYNDYSPPPSIRVHPNVVPSLATAFIRGHQTFEDMLDGWGNQSEWLGIREYYGIPAWNSAMPGQARAADPRYLARTIPEFHAEGARFMNAESDDSWGPNGLGYWLAARMLWDIGEAERIEELMEEFTAAAFGEAREPMRRFYNLITGRPQVSEHLVGTMYELLLEAGSLTEDLEVLARLDDVILYTRFVELHRAYTAAPREAQQAAFDELMTFTWRTRGTMMVDALGMIDWLQRQQRNEDHLSWANGYNRVHPSDIHRAQEDQSLQRGEILQIANSGALENQTIDFQPIGFSHRLAPAVEALGLQIENPLPRAGRTRARTENYTWIDTPGREFDIQLRSGVIYDNRGPAIVSFQWWDEDLDEFITMAEEEVEPTGEWKTVRFKAESEGLHRVVWDERMSGTDHIWPSDLPRTTPMGEDHHNITVGRDSFYFYVPAGTRVLGLYADVQAGQLHGPFGDVLQDFDGAGRFADFLSIEVPEGMDGKLWSFRNLAGHVRLLTVPPYVADAPGNLLLPRELIDEERVQKTTR